MYITYRPTINILHMYMHITNIASQFCQGPHRLIYQEFLIPVYPPILEGITKKSKFVRPAGYNTVMVYLVVMHV